MSMSFKEFYNKRKLSEDIKPLHAKDAEPIPASDKYLKALEKAKKAKEDKEELDRIPWDKSTKKHSEDDQELLRRAGLDEAKNWIQKAINKDHKGYCTPLTKKTCTPHRKALALRFKSGEFKK